MPITFNDEGAVLFEALLEVTKQAGPIEPGYVYNSAYDFVSRHGKQYPRVPFVGKKMPQLICFGNAMVTAALHGLRYIEGFALSPKGDVILHAWNLDRDGNVHDTTWRNTGVAYIGVEFSVERADEALWEGDASILHDEHRGWPIFKQLWQGEDYSIQWPRSDRLDALRAKNISLATSVTQWLEKREAQQ